MIKNYLMKNYLDASNYLYINVSFNNDYCRRNNAALHYKSKVDIHIYISYLFETKKNSR